MKEMQVNILANLTNKKEMSSNSDWSFRNLENQETLAYSEKHKERNFPGKDN